MSGHRKVILDIDGGNFPPADYVVVVDPVGLVQHALESDPLYVKGKDLCTWAGTLAVGRDWHVTEERSPAIELCEKCPTLSPEGARTLVAELGNRLPDLARPLQLADVLEKLYGEVGLWTEEPGDHHAFNWLCWVAQQADIGAGWELVWQLAQNWQVQTEPPLKTAYSARSGTEAWSLLQKWLRVCKSEHLWPEPPQMLPKGNLAQRLKEELIKQAVETGTEYFSALLDLAPDKELLKVAAQACADVLLKNTQEATSEQVHLLERYLPHDTLLKLRDLVRPDDPGLPKWQFDQLVAWFTEEYLPYREWTYRHRVTSDHRGWAVHSATEFARQYLEYYVSARVGGDGAGHLAWVESAHLRKSRPDFACLLVVLDGLAYPDALRLREYVENNTRRLCLDRQTMALGPLPTVTEFAKPSVSKGILPSEAIEANTTTTYASVEEVGRALLTAAPGGVLVWLLQEPDRTYHFRADAGPDSVRREADAQLLTIGKGIASLAEMAPSDLSLRVVVTTDHGRMLVNTERTRPIPQGMKAHGRAAWGACDVRFDKSGFFVNGDLVYLDPVRFGLPQGQGYAVIISDQAFLTTDGRKGNEPFPHGGLFPEEVLVPWLEFSRDRASLAVDFALRGRGEEGKAGTGILTVTNSSDVPLTLTALTVEVLRIRCAIEKDVGALQKQNINIMLPKWPSRQDLENLVVCLTYLLPDGQPVKHEFRPELETESIYEKPDILRELGGL